MQHRHNRLLYLRAVGSVNEEAEDIVWRRKGISADLERCAWMEDQINCCVGLGTNPDRDGIMAL